MSKQSHGHALHSSSYLNDKIQGLVQEVQKAAANLTEPRPPDADLKIDADKWFQHTGVARGRPLHYNYVGSGLGKGPFVELIDGSVKLDLINGIGIHLLGHSHPKVLAAAIRGALSDVVNQGNLQPNEEYTQIIDKVLSLAKKGSRLKHGWLSTCGTMANETALKITRQKNSPARLMVSFSNAFAGRSTMMAELTDNPSYKQGLPEYHEVLRIPFYNRKDPHSGENSLRALKEHAEKHPNNISTFCFEPMLGEGGYFAAPREFFVPLLDFCRQTGIAVWADEVQTFTRTGQAFAFQTLDIGNFIDVCTIAKTAQVGMTLYTEDFNPKPGLIAGTFSGSSSALSAGIEILSIMEHDNYFGPKGRISEIHNKFVGMLNNLNETTCAGLLQDAGGMGLMIAVTPYDGKKEQVDALLKRMFENGLMAFSCGKDPVRVRFLIPAIISNEEIELAGRLFEKSLLNK